MNQPTNPNSDRARSKINGYQLQNAASLPEVEDRKPLVDDFMYDTDTMFLYAPSGGYKSMVAINLAVAVASGATFMGRKAHQARVLYVDGELSQYSFKERLGLFGSPEQLDILSECYQDTSQLHRLPPIHIEKDGEEDSSRSKRRKPAASGGEEGKPKGWQAELLTLIDANQYKLVVFDNVRTLTDGINENDAADITPLNTLVKRLRHMGCAVLVVHHTRKAEGGGGEAVYAGSTNFLTVYNTCIGINTVGLDGISFDVIKDREKSVGDYFRESCWRLGSEAGAGFSEFDAFSAEYKQMERLMVDIRRGEFTTKGAITAAARSKYGLKFRSDPSAFKGLHRVLADAGVVSETFHEFEGMVRSGITCAKAFEPEPVATTNDINKEDF